MLRSACRAAGAGLALGVATLIVPIGAGAQIAPAPVGAVPADTMCARDSGATRTRFTIAPYGWMLGVSGEMGVLDLATDVDVSFSELLSDLRFAAMGTFEVERGPWLGVVDAIYASLRDDRTRSIGQVQGDLDMTLKLLITQAYIGYSFMASPDIKIDLLAGARLWVIDVSLRASAGGPGQERSRDPSWANALGGLRVRWRAAERWQVTAAGDAGGGAERGTAGLLASAGYDLSRRWVLFGAYRYLELNYRKNDFSFDGNFHGPVIGAAYRW